LHGLDTTVPTARKLAFVVSSAATPGSWADVRTAERLQLERAGATARAARRIAGTVVPGSRTGGGGCGLELDRSLSAGDIVELEIERLGVLRNRIGTPARRERREARGNPAAATS